MTIHMSYLFFTSNCFHKDRNRLIHKCIVTDNDANDIHVLRQTASEILAHAPHPMFVARYTQNQSSNSQS